MRRAVVTASVCAAAVMVWGTLIGAALLGSRVSRELNRAVDLAHIGARPQATVVFDRGDRPVFSFYLEQRQDVDLDRVSPHMIAALLSVEDRRFYNHHGLDAARIVKAAWRNWRAGRIVEGGSTITQQLARAEQLTATRTMSRKIREAMIAAAMEERYTKREILAAYLNTVYFGEGYYGIEAASRGYFGKGASGLLPHEAALLAALVRSPSAYSPITNPSRARSRRNLVLRLMRVTGALDETAYRAAVASPLGTRATGAAVEASASRCGQYYEEEVRRELIARFGGQQVLRGGLRVYTAYDEEMQCSAERAITARISAIAKRRSAARDLQGSLVALDPASGEVRALVGGRDFAESSFNRAVQARRQPGSAFKPIIYAAAMERGFAPGSVLHNLDDPIMTPQGPWLPRGGHEQSDYTLRAALRISSNRAAAHLLQEVGFRTTEYYAERMGISSKLPSVPSLALGTGGVTLMELTAAYAVFANQGVAMTPHVLTRVEDRDGRLLWGAAVARTSVLSPASAFLMNSMLRDVVVSGTGSTVRAAGFRLPAGGKTGTTDDYTDAWFIGYTPHLVAGVWFGMDRPAPIMSRGFASVVAVPAWAEFMTAATRHDRPDWYPVPPDVEKVAICPLSGLRATEACRHGWIVADSVQPALSSMTGIAVATSGQVRPAAVGSVSTASTDAAGAEVIEDYFAVGTAPSETCTMHGVAGGVAESLIPHRESLIPHHDR